MSNAVHCFCNLGRNNDNTILITDNGITRANDSTRNANDSVALPRLHGGRTLTGSGSVRKAREAVVDNLIGITNGTVSDETANVALLQTEEFDVTSDGLMGTNRGHDKDLIGTAKLKRLILWAVATGRLVGGDIRTGRNKVQSDGPTDAFHVRRQRTGIVDLGRRPAHHPQAIDQGLGREGAELLEQFVRDFTSRGWSGGHCAGGGHLRRSKGPGGGNYGTTNCGKHD
mmetsp:Transcript_13785/g.29976  ORF Transcript_13785/g.29976 Transcript_13785/m.29976 type:complete len:228 (+) Transcript_13785:1404-2087(+)